MIPFVDVAFANFITNVFSPDLPKGTPNVLVAWGTTAQSFAVLNAAGEANAQKCIDTKTENIYGENGIPGVCLFRPDILEDTGRRNFPEMAPTGGKPSGMYDPDTLTQVLVREYPVKAIYDVTVWSQYQSELNNLDRLLAFCSIYTGLPVVIVNTDENGDEVTNTVPVYMEASAPKYDWIVQKDTTNILWYSVARQFSVSCYWYLTNVYPVINSVTTLYNEMVSGSPITLESTTFTSADIPDGD